MTSATMHNSNSQDGLFEMAVQALRQGDSTAAVARLEEAASRGDASARACYLLGAQYAQMNRFDDAAHQFDRAVALNPALSVARFQHGLLALTMGDAPESTRILSPLLQLGEIDPFTHFAAGLLHLVRNEFANALACLERGIVLNAANPPLNADMRKLMDRIHSTIATAAAEENEGTTSNATPHVLLSAYTGKGL
jgi:tetratricopeptide (TPR) repeat protein